MTEQNEFDEIRLFKKKYGTLTPGLLIGKLVLLAPDFPGDLELARELGRMIADLETALNPIKVHDETNSSCS